MSKLGYTFYPKDWSSSESVFELNLIERGFYRELIDLAMLNDNKIELKHDVWSRKFNSNKEEINNLLERLKELKIIIFKGEILTVPSCEMRLNLIRGGQKGGLKSKPIPKPYVKPIPKPTSKGDSNQREIKDKIKGKENIGVRPSLSDVISFFSVSGYSKDVAENAFYYYEDLNWFDSKGNEIKNWKHKMQKVWFKPENREEEKRHISKGYTPQIPN